MTPLIVPSAAFVIRWMGGGVGLDMPLLQGLVNVLTLVINSKYSFFFNIFHLISIRIQSFHVVTAWSVLSFR